MKHIVLFALLTLAGVAQADVTVTVTPLGGGAGGALSPIAAFNILCNATGSAATPAACGSLPSGFAVSLSNLPMQATSTVLGNSSGSQAVPSAQNALPPGMPTNGYDTPNKEGAVGSGAVDDTTAMQACASTGLCQIPCGYNYKVSSTVSVPNGGVFGNNLHWGCSTITGNSVSGPCVTVGTTGTGAALAEVGGFEVAGSCTIGFASYQSYLSNFHDIWLKGNFSQDGFHIDDSSFSSPLYRLSTNTANVGSTVTFSASVGGATSGTVSSGTLPANGAYPMVFADGEIRIVTVSGSAWSWSTALQSVTINTVAYGGDFNLGGGSNAMVCNECYTGGSAAVFNFIFHDSIGGLGSGGLVLNAPVAQNGQVGYFFGNNTLQVTIIGLYAEDVVAPIVYGSAASNVQAGSVLIDGAIMSGPLSSHPQYANRALFIDAQLGHGLKINSPVFSFSDGTSPTAYPLTFTGGTQTTAPKAYAYANAAGVIKGVAILAAGTYTTGNPPTAVSCSACSGSPTFTFTTGLAEFGQLGVTGVTVTSGGSGNTLSTGMAPVGINKAGQVSIDSPSYPWGLSADNNGISPILVYDSINPSGSSAFGIADTNDGGQYDPAGSFGRPTGISCFKAAEYNYREWCQYVAAGGALATYAVPMNPFP